jgi:PAS domain S-box-containing protein
MQDMKREDRFHLQISILDSIEFGIWAIDTSYRLLYCNNTFKTVYGQIYNESVQVGHNLLDDLNTVERTSWKTHYDQALSGESFVSHTCIFRVDPDTTISAKFEPIKGADGTIIGCFVVTEDTTAFSKVINKLKSNERVLESIVNNTDDIIVLIDRGMNILHFNHGLSLLVENRWGFKPEPGMHISNVIETGYTQEHLDLYTRGLNGEQFSQIEEYLNQDGDPVFIETSYNPVYEDDGTISSLAIHSRDITLRKLAEIDLIKSKERAEELNRLKTNFLANMSHEIRTPINGILGLAEIMADETDINNIKDYTMYLRESGRRLLNTITSILDVSKLEAEGTNIKLEPVPVDVVVCEVIDLLKPIAYVKGISLDMISDNGTYLVLADRVMMGQVFTNIIGNAVKFTMKGGVTVEVGYKSMAGSIVVTVTDTGIGISDEFLPRLFDVFEQESSGTGRSFEGSGLGLAITHKFIHLIGGSISVSSKKNVGTSFEVRLPTYKLVN